ncbi:SDR family NAD(P)-dependent oxidoreductase [Actinomycetospora chiangmaiensis]|uniref:SDR family NAD(P)-dependent oxidoreductase n=1 Tax=Actinomycetospora chiangmaiensis TaxID=402650 RepID=UPI00036C4D3A|nr:SDR family NAD(P)-dependent oxidoreductase [Actinomycetospora chiangmaiensis]
MNLLSLKGRTALITGAGQGVGAQVARHCAAHGARVVVNDFHAERAEAVAAGLRDEGAQATARTCDVTDYEAVSAMVTSAAEEFGPVDVLVNNAGNAGPSADPMAPAPPFWESEPADWKPWVDVNFYGVLNASRACVPAMVERGHGRVITVISDAARVGDAQLAVYGGAKAGAAGFSRGLARAVGRHGITVNCVALSAVRTPGVATAVEDASLVKAMLRQYSIRRLGEPDDAANLVLFLASDAATWITGQTYPVNGGFAVST